MKKIIIIDFDGTLCDHRYPEVGRIKKGAKEALRQLKDMGYYIKIHSCRTSKLLNDDPKFITKHCKIMSSFLQDNEIPYDEIIMETDKPVAYFYIDDRAIGFRNDWKEVVEEVKKMDSGYNYGREE